MRNLLAALVCFTLTTFAGGQTTTGNSTSAQHANTEKSVQSATQPKDLTAIIETTAGNITCTLFPDQAPLTVANFIGLATGTKAWK
ncbi:MAG TPA: peptidylprolyl isomerase, partial [Candidatus Limnocylindrales bacterium]|nr:peptidylprolyl isomerase [Candidatus Limnocylindrales bacterium]